MLISLSLLLLTASALRAIHTPSEISEYKRQLTSIGNYLYLGSDASVMVFPISNVNATFSVIALTPFSSTVPLKIRRVFSTMRENEILVHANASMYHPISYLYFLSTANVSSITVTRSFPITATSLDEPILAYTNVGAIEYIVVIDGFSALKLMKLQANGVVLLDTVTEVQGAALSPYSIAVEGSTVVTADLENGFMVFTIEDDTLSWTQTIAVQGSATTVSIANNSAWIGTENGIYEYARNLEEQFEQIEFVYPMTKKGWFPYYLVGNQDVVAYMQYSTKDKSHLSVFPRLQLKSIVDFSTRFDPFLVLGSSLYTCARSKMKKTNLNLS